MKLEGSVALVVGADHAVGAAIVRGLLARHAVTVYAASNEAGGGRPRSGAVHLAVDLARPAHAAALARELADVTVLVNCLVAAAGSTSSRAGPDILPPGRRRSTVRRTLALIEALAPVLAANGGGAVVNVLSVPCADQALIDTAGEPAHHTADWVPADSLRDRLSAQGTQLLCFRAQLALGNGDRLLDDQRALPGHVAMRVLDRLEAGDRPDDGKGAARRGESLSVPFRAGSTRPSEHGD